MTGKSLLCLVAAIAIVASMIAPPAAAQSDPTLIPGEFLVRRPNVVTADMEQVSSSWYLIREEPLPVAARAATLSRLHNTVVIPNRIVELANDPRFGDQWALENSGQTGGTVGADISIDGAWPYTTGSADVIIAVIDTGIDLDHPDLVDRVWVNPGEVPANGIDDDNNGYIDDVGGWDFAADDNDPNDTHGHGTSVAGVAAASLNGVGTVGVAPGVTIMPLRACTSSCPMSWLIEAVAYAKDNGADIINLSVGGTGPFFDPLIDGIGASPDVIVTAAAGNAGGDSDVDPFFPAGADLPNILSVASTDHDDQLSSFSNFGLESVDLGAPGEDVLSTSIGGWATVSGTSFSAPYVAGVAALILSLRPGFSVDELIDQVLDKVDPVPALDGAVATGGRLNAGLSVFSATAPVAVISSTASAATVPSTLSINADSSFDPSGTIVTFVWTLDGVIVADSSSADLEIINPKAQVLSLSVVDNDGLSADTSTVIDLNGAPTISIGGSPLLGVAPLAITLVAQTEDPDGDDIAVTWFVDGAPSPTSSPLLESRGTYALHAVANDGLTTQASLSLTVLVGEDFTDTTESVFLNDITWASAVGVTRGCGEGQFCPSRPMTRGQAAAFLARWLHLRPGVDAFADDEGHLFENDINSLARAGITFGCGSNRFCPDAPIARDAWAALLRRALDLPAGSDRFVDDTTSIFENDINALAAAGLTLGCNPPDNDRYCPQRLVTRAEAMAMLHRRDRLAVPTG